MGDERFRRFIAQNRSINGFVHGHVAGEIILLSADHDDKRRALRAYHGTGSKIYFESLSQGKIWRQKSWNVEFSARFYWALYF